MSTDVDPKHFLFHGKFLLFLIFPNIWIGNLKRLLVFFSKKIHQTHLSCDLIFPFFLDTIDHTGVDDHLLLSCYMKTI